MQIITMILFHIIASSITVHFLVKKFNWKENIYSFEKNISLFIIIGLLSGLSIINETPGIGFINMISLLCLFMLIYLHLYQDGKFLEKLYWVSLIECVSACTMMISVFFLRQITGQMLEYGIEFSNLKSPLLLVFVIGVEYMSLYVVTKYTPKLKYLNISILVSTIIANFFSLGVILILNTLIDNIFSLFISTALLLSYIPYFFTLHVSSKSIEKLNLIELDYQMMKLKSKYYKEVEYINQEVKKYRHDMANHLNYLYYLIDTHDSSEAKEYIEQMGIDLKKIHKGFNFVETGNKSIDYILNSKLFVAHEKGIEIINRIGNVNELFISEANLCTLLTNLLDNSIEACLLYQEKTPFISINLQLIKNTFVINIKNSSNPVNIDKKGNFITNKKEGDHGFGILQINRIVKQYDGHVSRKYQDNIFETSIILLSPQEH